MAVNRNEVPDLPDYDDVTIGVRQWRNDIAAENAGQRVERVLRVVDMISTDTPLEDVYERVVRRPEPENPGSNTPEGFKRGL